MLARPKGLICGPTGSGPPTVIVSVIIASDITAYSDQYPEGRRRRSPPTSSIPSLCVVLARFSNLILHRNVVGVLSVLPLNA
jgi:hypothetical protein